MLRAALAFLVIALIAALFGFVGIANVSTDMAWVLFFVFLCLAVVSFIANGFRGRTVDPI
jgi:uncharacterized membrane protein YtjA (UPF0391 family)